MKKFALVLMFIATLVFSVMPYAFAEDPGCTTTSTTSSETLQKIIDACKQQLQGLSQKKSTLADQIAYMDTQINVTQLEINQNTQEIETLQKEISNLGKRIGELDVNLDQVSKIVNKKIEDIYKKQKTGFIYTVLDAGNLPNFLRSIQYLQKSQKNDRELLLKMQNTKVNFGEQKNLRQQKEEELSKLTDKLENYKVDLANQQEEKEVLLQVTNNDELRYQQILRDAQAQIAGFKNFVANATVGGVIGSNGLGTGYDGTYFSQRDERWANNTIGLSSENILNVGCLLTSVAMALRNKGVDTNPAAIASSSNYFFGNTAYMLYRNQLSLPGGHNGQSISIDAIDSNLNNNNAVIVGLYAGGYGTHFIVLKKIDNGEWIMFDPYYGPDLKFSSHYSESQIFSAEIIN